MEVKNSAQEKIIKAKSGWTVLILSILLYAADIFALGICGMKMENGYGEVSGLYVALFVLTMIYVCLGWIWWLGLKVIGPNEALVLTLFGKYIGTLKDEGFFYVNPFCAAVNPAAKTKLNQSGDVSADSAQAAAQAQTISKKISLKVMTLNNNRQKINDCLGNPIEIGIAVMWRVSDTAKAVFNVDNFKEYLSLQCDAALREIVRIYPYDVAPNVDTTGDGIADEGSLRGSSEIVASRIREKIEEKVGFAGLEIIEARITYLAYAPEIAAIMLQRQQASRDNRREKDDSRRCGRNGADGSRQDKFRQYL